MASRRERRRRREARDAGRRGALLALATASWRPAAPPILPLAPSYVDGGSDTPLFTAVCVDRGGLPASPAGTVWGCSMYEAVVDELDQQPPWRRPVISCPPSAVSGVAALIAAITEPTALLEAVHG